MLKTLVLPPASGSRLRKKDFIGAGVTVTVGVLFLCFSTMEVEVNNSLCSDLSIFVKVGVVGAFELGHGHRLFFLNITFLTNFYFITNKVFLHHVFVVRIYFEVVMV